jgi:Na+/proline symporter
MDSDQACVACGEPLRLSSCWWKSALIWSFAWLVLMVMLGAIGMWYIRQDPGRPLTVDQRDSKLGDAIGKLGGWGTGIIWVIAYRSRR